MTQTNDLLHRLAALVPVPLVTWLGRIQFERPWTARLLRWVTTPLVGGDLKILRGAGAGLRINAARANPGYVLGTTEPSVQQALSRYLRSGDTFYDVGAGIGFFTLIAARLVGPTGRVVALEPNPITAAALRHNVDLNGFRQVEVMPSAAGALSGSATMMIDGTASRLVPEAMVGRERTAAVEIVSIDGLVEEGKPAPTFVKLDVEGAELEVLRGMADTVLRTKPRILCETHGTQTVVEGWLLKVGYQIELLDEVVAGQTPWNVHVLARPADRA